MLSFSKHCEGELYFPASFFSRERREPPVLIGVAKYHLNKVKLRETIEIRLHQTLRISTMCAKLTKKVTELGIAMKLLL
jgi:hypothetical protein